MVNARRTTTPGRPRRGSAAIEEVMVLAAVLPVVTGCFYLGVRIFRLFHDVVVTLVGWPFP